MITKILSAVSESELLKEIEDYEFCYPKVGYGTNSGNPQPPTEQQTNWTVTVTRLESCD